MDGGWGQLIGQFELKTITKLVNKSVRVLFPCRNFPQIHEQICHNLLKFPKQEITAPQNLESWIQTDVKTTIRMMDTPSVIFSIHLRIINISCGTAKVCAKIIVAAPPNSLILVSGSFWFIYFIEVLFKTDSEYSFSNSLYGKRNTPVLTPAKKYHIGGVVSSWIHSLIMIIEHKHQSMISLSPILWIWSMALLDKKIFKIGQNEIYPRVNGHHT